MTKKINVVNAKVGISKLQDKVAMVFVSQDALIMKIGSEIVAFASLDFI